MISHLNHTKSLTKVFELRVMGKLGMEIEMTSNTASVIVYHVERHTYIHTYIHVHM